MTAKHEKSYVFDESQKKIEKTLKDLEFKVAPLNQITGILGSSSFVWKGFFLKEKSVYLETSLVEMSNDTTLPEELQKKTDFLFNKGIICVFIFDADFSTDNTLREAIYTRVLKAEAAKNAVKINDLTKVIYSNTFTKKEEVPDIVDNEVIEKKDIEEKKETEEKIIDSSTDNNPVVEKLKENISETKKAKEDVPSDEEIIEKVLTKLGYIYKKDFKDPLDKEPKYWKEKFYLNEEKIYVGYCSDFNSLKGVEKKAALDEKKEIESGEVPFILLTNMDLFDEHSLSEKIKKDISNLKKINDELNTKQDDIDPTKDIVNSFDDEPKESYNPISYTDTNYSSTAPETDFTAILGGILIVLIVLFFLLILFVFIYMVFLT